MYASPRSRELVVKLITTLALGLVALKIHAVFLGILAVFMLMALRTTYQSAKIALLLGDELLSRARHWRRPRGGAPASDYCDAHGENSFAGQVPEGGVAGARQRRLDPHLHDEHFGRGYRGICRALSFWCLIAGMLLSFVLEVGVHAHSDSPRAWVWVVPAIYAVPIAIALIVMVDRRHSPAKTIAPSGSDFVNIANMDNRDQLQGK